MDERRKLIIEELKKYCQHYNVIEFEYYWEIWGILWYPWFIEIEKKSCLNFTHKDISYTDLDYFVNCGQLELIKEYSLVEMDDEFDRKRYRITNLV